MERMNNCKNCGAPVSGHYCQYCGSPTYTPTESAFGAHGKRVHCWYEDGGVKCCFDMFVNRIEVEPEYTTIYTDSMPYATMVDARNMNISAEMLDFDHEAWAEHFGHWGNDA